MSYSLTFDQSTLPELTPRVYAPQIAKHSASFVTDTAFDVLEPAVRAQVWAKWKTPCEDAFEYLAEYHPAELLKLIRFGFLSPTDLTFAVEIAGKHSNSVEVLTVLTQLLFHPNALVREGALLGLRDHELPWITPIMQYVAGNDSNESVRFVATEILTQN